MRVLVNVLAHIVLPCMHHALAAPVLLATTCCEKLGQLQRQAAVVYRGHCVGKHMLVCALTCTHTGLSRIVLLVQRSGCLTELLYLFHTGIIWLVTAAALASCVVSHPNSRCSLSLS